MTKVTIYKNADDVICGFDIDGHAGYDDKGYDIVCSAISILTITAINSIESFTSDGFKCEANEDKGTIHFFMEDVPCETSQIILKSMVLGLDMISNDYGKGYIRITFKEV